MTTPASTAQADASAGLKPAVRLVVLSGGVSDPSATRLLADRAAQKTIDHIRAAGRQVSVTVIELGQIGVEIAQAIVSGFPGERLQSAIEQVASADAIIASTPVYKAGISGLFKSFIDVLDNDLVIAKPVILAATAGTARHAMVVDEQLRPLFSFMRAMPVPTSLFAAPDDWGSSAMGSRIDRAAYELSVLALSGVSESITENAWSEYQHQFAGNAAGAERDAGDVDFSTDLMRLAAGGK
jgi:FMN reductase